MAGHEDSFRQRQMLGCKDVESCNANDGGENEKGALPSLGVVAVVIESNQALNDHSDNVRVDRDDGLPCNNREPP